MNDNGKTDPRRLKLIWSMRRFKHIGEKDFRQIVLQETGNTSTKRLMDEQADGVIARLRSEKPRKPTGRPRHRQPVRVSDNQLNSIFSLGVILRLGEKGLDSMVRRQFKAVGIRALTPGQACKFHEALKSMHARGWRAK